MTTPDLTHEDVDRILRLIDELSDVEIKLETDNLKLHVRKFSAASEPSSLPGFAGETLAAAPADAAPLPAAPSEAVSAASRIAASPDREPTAPSRSRPASAIEESRPPISGEPSNIVAIRAPMLGRFYRAASPNDAPFVEVGSRIRPEDTVCLIEVMKLFNTVKAGLSGTIVEIIAENNAMVEYDQVLFTIEPA